MLARRVRLCTSSVACTLFSVLQLQQQLSGPSLTVATRPFRQSCTLSFGCSPKPSKLTGSLAVSAGGADDLQHNHIPSCAAATLPCPASCLPGSRSYPPATTTNLLQVKRVDGLQHMHIPAGQQYQSPGEAYVEGDASSASYFLAGDRLQPGTSGLDECRPRRLGHTRLPLNWWQPGWRPSLSQLYSSLLQHDSQPLLMHPACVGSVDQCSGCLQQP